jgi:hypothetical protein
MKCTIKITKKKKKKYIYKSSHYVQKVTSCYFNFNCLEVKRNVRSYNTMKFEIQTINGIVSNVICKLCRRSAVKCLDNYNVFCLRCTKYLVSEI